MHKETFVAAAASLLQFALQLTSVIAPKAVGLLDWKRPAGSDLGALAVRDELHSEPVVIQRLE